MQFAVISPIGGLERYSRRSRIHLVLPQVTNSQYREFYRSRRSDGDFLILDNGAYEGWQLSFKDLDDAIQFYKPQVTVLPDVTGMQAIYTLRKVKEWFASEYSKGHETEWMGVPQAMAGNVMDWWHCLIELMLMKGPQINWIGLPRNMVTDIWPPGYGRNWDVRARVAREIYEMDPTIKIHALGMVEGSVAELALLRETSIVNSIDSSAPVWRGWHGHLLAQERIKSLVLPVEFSYDGEPDTVNHNLIEINLTNCGVPNALE